MTFNEVLLSSRRVNDRCSVSRGYSKNDKEIEKIESRYKPNPSLSLWNSKRLLRPITHKKYFGSTPIHHLVLISLIEFNSREGIQVKISIHDKRSSTTWYDFLCLWNNNLISRIILVILLNSDSLRNEQMYHAKDWLPSYVLQFFVRYLPISYMLLQHSDICRGEQSSAR